MEDNHLTKDQPIFSPTTIAWKLPLSATEHIYEVLLGTELGGGGGTWKEGPFIFSLGMSNSLCPLPVLQLMQEWTVQNMALVKNYLLPRALKGTTVDLPKAPEE